MTLNLINQMIDNHCGLVFIVFFSIVSIITILVLILEDVSNHKKHIKMVERAKRRFESIALSRRFHEMTEFKGSDNLYPPSVKSEKVKK